MLVTSFAEASAIELQNRRISEQALLQLTQVAGVDQFVDTLEIIPLVEDNEYATLAEAWKTISPEEFPAVHAREALRRLRRADHGVGSRDPLLKLIDTKLRAYHKTLRSLFPVPGEVDPVNVF